MLLKDLKVGSLAVREADPCAPSTVLYDWPLAYSEPITNKVEALAPVAWPVKSALS